MRMSDDGTIDYICRDCIDAPAMAKLETASRVIARQENGERGEFDDTDSCTIFATRDGKIGVFEEQSDSTGHG